MFHGKIAYRIKVNRAVSRRIKVNRMLAPLINKGFQSSSKAAGDPSCCSVPNQLLT